MSEQETVTVAGDRQNPVYLALAVLGVVVVLVLLWFFVISPLLSDGDEVDTAAQPTPTVEATDVPDDDESPVDEDADVTLPVETYEIFLARDPFQPVRPEEIEPGEEPGEPGEEPGEPGEPGDGETPDGVDDDGDDGTDGDGALPPTDGRNGTDGDGTDGRDDREEVEGREVVLIDVFEENGEERAVVQVDNTSYTVSEGDTFADNFRALSIDPPCVTLLYGDDRFTLCEGDRVMK